MILQIIINSITLALPLAMEVGMTAFPELPPPTDRFADFTESEQLVLSCFRRFLAGPQHREILARTLAHDLAPAEARAAMKGLEATIRVLTAHASRNIAYHRPCCPCVGGDEVALLTVVTAVQRGETILARMVARNFVPEERLGLILGAVSVFADALKRTAVELPLRFAFCGDQTAIGGEIEELTAEELVRPGAAAPTLH